MSSMILFDWLIDPFIVACLTSSRVAYIWWGCISRTQTSSTISKKYSEIKEKSETEQRFLTVIGIEKNVDLGRLKQYNQFVLRLLIFEIYKCNLNLERPENI